MKDNLTIIPPIPENILKWGTCLMLHTKTPHWDGTYIEYEGKLVKEIKWICKECDNE